MKEKMHALKQSAYYGALNGTLTAALLGGVVLVICLVSVISTNVGRPINWYALVIEGIVLLAIIVYLVNSQNLERAPFIESVQFCSVWILAWILTAALVFFAITMVTITMTAIAMAQSWLTRDTLIISIGIGGGAIVWCLFMYFCPEPSMRP